MDVEGYFCCSLGLFFYGIGDGVRNFVYVVDCVVDVVDGFGCGCVGGLYVVDLF